ncbi:DUF945 family protein [Marinobacter sp. UBA3607]|uniref:DUF945 family protein n=1 Tax=Marinobacter sp. UBA3607 TaxID=1946820 RepID=UPI00257D8DB1|nr:DUF945 family protein [Marinobacter sp. UBA3607]
MKFNKWLVAGGVILAGAGLAPWGVGYVTEQQWSRAALEVNAAQPFVHLETRQYQRGVLASEADGTLTITDPARGDSYRVDFRVKVSHGVTGSLMDFRPDAGWQPEGANWFRGEKPRLTLETRVWGSATLVLEAPAMAIDNPASGESLRSSGGLASISVGSLGEKADLMMVWPALSLSGPELDLAVDDVHLEQSLAWLNGDIWTGTGTLSVESLSVQSPGAEPVVLNDLAMTSASEAKDQDRRLDSTLELDVASVSVGSDAFGPQRMAVSVDNLDVAGWNAFSSAMTDLQAMTVKSGAGGGARFEEQMAVMQRFNESIRDLAAAGFSAGIRELSLETPEGPVQGSLDISHPELAGAEKDAMLMVMQGLTGELDFSMPMALAEDYAAVRMQVAPLIKQGLLVQEGDRLVMDGRMEDLVLDINGLQIPLPPLL